MLTNQTPVREQTIPSERPPLVGEVNANILRLEGIAWSARRTPSSLFSALSTGAGIFFFQIVPQLFSQGWVVSVPHRAILTLLLNIARRADVRIVKNHVRKSKTRWSRWSVRTGESLESVNLLLLCLNYCALFAPFSRNERTRPHVSNSIMDGRVLTKCGDPIKYRRVLVSTLLHVFVYDFTTFAECIGTDCK
jgi:hypothetical protein